MAESAGMARSTVSFHLDRLVQDGLLAVEFHKPPGKAGPGSGRPAKMYRPAAGEVGASVPDRNYDLAGELMAVAIETSQAGSGPVGEALRAAAFRRGRELAEASGSLREFLAQAGYRPQDDGEGGYLLPNCPFHRLSAQHASRSVRHERRITAGSSGRVRRYGRSGSSGCRTRSVLRQDHGRRLRGGRRQLAEAGAAAAARARIERCPPTLTMPPPRL